MSVTPIASHRRILFASLVGTSVEFYDFYIYATAAALVFPALFFPTTDPALAQLASYASFSVAFFARPLGGLVFGHYGDRMGRKTTLVASLMLMGISTVLIAFLPTYAMIGWVAPALLCLLRFGQGLGLGGEWGGASLLAVENAPPGWAYRYGAFPPMGAPVGFIFANGFFLLLGALLTDDQFREWGWRLPFLASAVLVGLGLWVRVKLTETPAFVEAQEAAPPPRIPVGELLREHWLPTAAGTIGTVACFALFYISTVFIIGYATRGLGYDRESFLAVELVAILFMAAGIWIASSYADRIGAAQVLAIGCVATVFVGLTIGLFVTGERAGRGVRVAGAGAVRDGVRLWTAGRMAAEPVSGAGALHRGFGDLQHRRDHRRRAHAVHRAGAGGERRAGAGGLVSRRCRGAEPAGAGAGSEAWGGLSWGA